MNMIPVKIWTVGKRGSIILPKYMRDDRVMLTPQENRIYIRHGMKNSQMFKVNNGRIHLSDLVHPDHDDVTLLVNGKRVTRPLNTRNTVKVSDLLDYRKVLVIGRNGYLELKKAGDQSKLINVGSDGRIYIPGICREIGLDERDYFVILRKDDGMHVLMKLDTDTIVEGVESGAIASATADVNNQWGN